MSSHELLYKKILFTLWVLFICRVGSFIPIAGVDLEAFHEIFLKNQSGVIGVFNMLSGGALERLSIFALAIGPYITSSIVIHLLSMAYKPLENMKKEGEVGKKKLSRISKYLTIFLSVMQAYAASSNLLSQNTSIGPIVVIDPLFFKLSTIITMTVGTMVLVWFADQISSSGIGNGSSLIIFVGVISNIPGAIINIFDTVRKGITSFGVLFLCLFALVAIISIIIFIERSCRKVVIQYPKRQVGNKIYGGESTHLPIKINTAGVIPPIFASFLLLFPMSLVGFLGNESQVSEFFVYYFARGRFLYVVCEILFIGLFTLIYTAAIFNSLDTAENLRKHGAYVPGKRPGIHTAEYLDGILSKLSIIATVYLVCICVIPEMLMNKFSIYFAISGTSLLIVVNVIMDTFNQVQTYLFSERYEYLMRQMKGKKKTI